LAWSLTLKRIAGNLVGIAAFSLLSLVSDARAYQVAVFLVITFIAFSFMGTGTVAMVTTWTAFAFSMAWLISDEFRFGEATGDRLLANLAGAAIALGAVFLLQRFAAPEPAEA
jgi:uncharacterized membrane protein YccC